MEDAPIVFDNTPRNQGVDTCIPKFFIREVERKVESLKAGRPIFYDVEWVKIYIPGDASTVVSRKVTDEHRERWPVQYQAFKRGQQQAVTGTPLEEWPVLTRARVAELKAVNILNVETLASLNDDAITRLGMGTRELVHRAQVFIKSAKDAAVQGKLIADLERKQQQIDAMQAQIDDLAEKLADATGKDVSRETTLPPVEVQQDATVTAAQAKSLDLDIKPVNYDADAEEDLSEGTPEPSEPETIEATAPTKKVAKKRKKRVKRKAVAA